MAAYDIQQVRLHGLELISRDRPSRWQGPNDRDDDRRNPQCQINSGQLGYGEAVILRDLAIPAPAWAATSGR